MRHTAAIAALALAGVPAGALAANASHPTTPANTNANSHANGTTTTTTTTSTTATHGKSAAVKVMFVIHGKVTSYTAGSSLGITVTSSNRDRSALTAAPAAFTVMLNQNTKIVLHDGAAVANGDMVLVQIRAAKNAQPSDLASIPAKQAIDQGAGQ
jgi:hypothetical protein